MRTIVFCFCLSCLARPHHGVYLHLLGQNLFRTFGSGVVYAHTNRCVWNTFSQLLFGFLLYFVSQVCVLTLHCYFMNWSKILAFTGSVVREEVFESKLCYLQLLWKTVDVGTNEIMKREAISIAVFTLEPPKQSGQWHSVSCKCIALTSEGISSQKGQSKQNTYWQKLDITRVL